MIKTILAIIGAVALVAIAFAIMVDFGERYVERHKHVEESE